MTAGSLSTPKFRCKLIDFAVAAWNGFALLGVARPHLTTSFTSTHERLQLMKTFIGTLVLTLGTSMVALAAPTTTKYSAKGDTATANAYVNGDCGYTSLDVSATEEAMRSGTTTTATKKIWVNYYSYDTCKGTESYGWAELPLSVDVNTDSVAFDLKLDVQTYITRITPKGEYSSELKGTSQLTASISIVGTGKLEKGTSRSTSSAGPYRSVYRYTGSYREASLTVKATLGTTPLTFTGSYATLGNYTSGSMEMYKSK